MDGFLDVSKALWKELYSRRDCIQQDINFPAVLWAWLKTKDVRFTQWPDVALFMCPTFVWLRKKLSLLSNLVFKFIVSLFVKKVFRISVLDPFL